MHKERAHHVRAASSIETRRSPETVREVHRAASGVGQREQTLMVDDADDLGVSCLRIGYAYAFTYRRLIRESLVCEEVVDHNKVVPRRIVFVPKRTAGEHTCSERLEVAGKHLLKLGALCAGFGRPLWRSGRTIGSCAAAKRKDQRRGRILYAGNGAQSCLYFIAGTRAALPGA